MAVRLAISHSVKKALAGTNIIVYVTESISSLAAFGNINIRHDSPMVLANSTRYQRTCVVIELLLPPKTSVIEHVLDLGFGRSEIEPFELLNDFIIVVVLIVLIFLSRCGC
jgi:hypothetical protein